MLKWSGRLAAKCLLAALLWAGSAEIGRAREAVAFDGGHEAGTIVIRTSERRLYLVTGAGAAIRYSVGVGKVGKQWSGHSWVDGKYVNPAWSPPPELQRDKPNIARYVAGGSPGNPMGVRALTLSGGEYAIHGTTQNMRKTVGTFASYGCIRMLNEDIVDLYERVRVGTPVVVMP